MSKLLKLIEISSSIAQVKFFKKRVPVFVSWTLLNRCNFTCEHCALWRTPINELDTEEIFKVLEDLKAQGTRFISFLGGEPLLRKDLNDIFKKCKDLGIKTRVTTNASLVLQYPERVADVGLLKISLDGLEDVHDSIRGEGSFKKCLETAEWAKRNNKNFVMNCVITKNLTERWDELEELINKLEIPFSFQPLEHRPETYFQPIGHDPKRESEYVKTIMPSAEEFKSFLNKVIRLKTHSPKLVANSKSGLGYLSTWPKIEPINCYAGRLFFRISPEGKFVSCDKIPESGIDLKSTSLNKQSISGLKEYGICQGCWRNNTIELNHALNFNLFSMKDLAWNYLMRSA